jgi:hypothetical protein
MKDFKQVSIGDTATTYSGDDSTVVDKGSIEDMLKKYPIQHWSLNELEGWGLSAKDDCVVVNKGDLKNIIYHYAYEGAYVK